MYLQVADHGWHHSAWVYDGTKLKMYLDGVLVNSVRITGNNRVVITVNVSLFHIYFLIVDDGSCYVATVSTYVKVSRLGLNPRVALRQCLLM